MKLKNRYHFDFSCPAAIVIDMQNDFCHEDGAYHRNDPSNYRLANIQKLSQNLNDFWHIYGMARKTFFIKKKIPI